MGAHPHGEQRLVRAITISVKQALRGPEGRNLPRTP